MKKHASRQCKWGKGKGGGWLMVCLDKREGYMNGDK